VDLVQGPQGVDHLTTTTAASTSGGAVTSVTGWMYLDALGSVRVISDSSGQTTAAAAYTDFGGLEPAAGSVYCGDKGNSSCAPGQLKKLPGPVLPPVTGCSPVGFTGQLADPVGASDGGVDWHFSARDYTPSTQSWLSPDPHTGALSQPQRVNAYSYVLDDPTTLVDPDGRDPAPANCAGSVECYDYYYSGASPEQQCVARNLGSDSAACAVGANGDGFYTPVIQTGSGGGTSIIGGDPWASDFERSTPTVAQASPGGHNGYYLDPEGDAARYGQVAHGITDWSTYWQQASNDGANGSSAIWQNGKILCYGQAACDAAATYLKAYPGDSSGAAYVAANYCYIHPNSCASYDQHRGIAQNLLLAGGGAAMGYYSSGQFIPADPTVDDLENLNPSTLGRIGAAGDPRIRQLSGGRVAAQRFFDNYSAGGTDSTPNGFGGAAGGRQVTMSDGSIINIRYASGTGDVAVTVNNAYGYWKIHFGN
jgi:RHS repeat-associated protein